MRLQSKQKSYFEIVAAHAVNFKVGIFTRINYNFALVVNQCAAMSTRANRYCLTYMDIGRLLPHKTIPNKWYISCPSTIQLKFKQKFHTPSNVMLTTTSYNKLYNIGERYRPLHHIAKLLKRYFTVSIFISLHNGFIDNLCSAIVHTGRTCCSC